MNDQLGHFTDICHRARCTLGIIHIKLPDKAFPQFHWQGNGRICEVEIRKISDKGRGGNWYEHSEGESLLHLGSAGTCALRPAQGRIATYVRNEYEGRYEGVGVRGGGGGQSR